MAEKRLYVANHKISGIEQSGVALPTLQPGRAYELDPDVAREFVEGGALRPVEGRQGVQSEPIPEDFPSYEKLVKEEEDTPTFSTIDDLKSATDEQIKSKTGIGNAALAEIREELDKYE